MTARKPLVVGSQMLVAEIDVADTLDFSSVQMQAMLVSLGMAVPATASGAIASNSFVSTDGDPVSGFTAFVAGPTPATGFAPVAIADGDIGLILLSGLVNARSAGAVLSAGSNLYLFTNGAVSSTAGSKGTVIQFIGIAAGSTYGVDGLIPVSLEFGESS